MFQVNTHGPAMPPRPFSGKGDLNAMTASVSASSCRVETTEGYCPQCGQNTIWDEVRSWTNPFCLSTLRQINVRVGWRCKVCDSQKRL